MVSSINGATPGPESSQRYLHIHLPSGEERVVALTGEDVSIGKAEKNSIVFDDAAVSSTHALLRFLNGEWLIADLASRNGVFVNHQRVSGSCVVRPGDLIQIGHCQLSLMTAPASARPKAKESAKIDKSKSRARATWIKVAGAMLAKVIGPIATLLIGLALSGRLLSSCGPHTEPHRNALPERPEVAVAHAYASAALADTAHHPKVRHRVHH